MSWAEMKIDDVTWACVDVETTGLEVEEGHRVCEVAAVRGTIAGPVEEFSALVNPGRPIDPQAAQVSGISDSAVADAPLFTDVAAEAHAFLSGAVLVAHNARFDAGFLEPEFARAGLALPTAPIVDTTIIAGAVLGLQRRSLGAVAGMLRLPDKPTHRALNDALTTRGVLMTGLKRLGERRITTLGEVMDALAPPDPPNLPLLGSPLGILRDALREGLDVRISYEGARGTTPRTVRPIRVETKGPNLVLDAYCRKRSAPRTFRLDRIASADIVT